VRRLRTLWRDRGPELLLGAGVIVSAVALAWLVVTLV
jgi:hypothetical protein